MIKNLQILRAFAALLVVFFHCDFLNIKVGQFGVDIFFVISGFIISFVLNKSQERFLSKRFIRVIPMYYLFTIGVACAWAIYPQGFNNVFVSLEAIVKSLLFIPYYIGDSGPILSLGWTLNYEIFFYVTAGVLAIFFKKPTLALLLATAVILLIICVGILNGSSNIYLRFYSYPITLEFVFGIGLFYITRRWAGFLHKKGNVFLAGILALLAFCLMVYFDHNKIYANRVLVFGIPAFFIVLFFILSEHITNADNFLHKFFYQVGNASYVVYLCHPFVVFFIIRIIKPLLPGNLLFSIIELLLMLGVVTFISILIHKKIELPVVKFIERRLHDKGRS